MGLIQYYQGTCQPVNQAICIFILCQLYCNLVSIKCIIVLLYNYKYEADVEKANSWWCMIAENNVGYDLLQP